MLAPRPAAAPPLTGWQQTWRVVVGILFGLMTWSGALSMAVTDHGSLALALMDLAVGLACIGPMLVRRRAPLAVAIGLTVATAVSSTAVGMACIALVSLATRRRWREVTAVLVPWIGAGFIYELIFPEVNSDIAWWVLGIIGLLGYGICVAIGFYIGARRELFASWKQRAETAEHEQSLRVSQARINERARIAREMHDVLAHRISLVAMHAGALAYRHDLSREETADAAGIVRDNAHQALADLRDVLGVLRDTDGRDQTERPQPTLADLGSLVEEAESAGTPVRLRFDVEEGSAVPEATARNAYRIVQEALTNARKHAPGAAVDLTVSGQRGDRILIEVRNGIPLRLSLQADDSPPPSGMGLMGLTERALLSGGELTYGRTPQGSYLLRAWLPWAA